MTVTLDLPETIARQLLDLPESERGPLVQKALEHLNEADNEGSAADAVDFHDFAPVNVNDLSPDDKAAVLQGAVSIKVGQGIPADEAMNDIEQQFRQWAESGK